MESDHGSAPILSLFDNRPRVGRSGPRKKTGCLTCRRRKIRCDETKPACQRCRRLQVYCVYPHQAEGQQQQGQRGVEPQPNASSSSSEQPQKLSRPYHRHRCQNATPQDIDIEHPACLGDQSVPGIELPAPLASNDETSLVGVDGLQNDGPRLPQNTIESMDFLSMDPSTLFAEFTDGLEGLFSETSPSQSAPESNDDVSQPHEAPIPVHQHGRVCPSYGIRLQQHLMSLASPPRLIISIESDWKDVRTTILKMAETSASLSNALYAFADAHLSVTEGREPLYATGYYDQSSMELEESMSKDMVESKDLTASFAAAFFLIYVELLVPIRSKIRPPRYHLRSTHAIIRKHKSRFSSWRGVGRKIVTWLVLLDSKAAIAGREGALLDDMDLTMVDDALALSANDESVKSLSGLDIIFKVLNKDPFRFYLKLEQFTHRIIQIDKWHRPRGSLNDELETLQIGKQIDADMDRHWSSRPALMDLANSPEQLSEIVCEPLARYLGRAIRQYLAQFHAHRVHLHRVAFRRYPREEKVDHAMQEILRLAKIDAVEGVLPSAFKWPLFMVGLEANAQDREWIEGALCRMAAANDLDHAGAEMTLQVLQVISRRQDAGDNSVDSIAVRNELFKGSLDII